MDFSGQLWGIWAVIVIVSFGALEAWAILGKSGEPKTLTEILRRWMGIQPRRWWRTAASIGLLAFLAWLALHLIWGF